MAAVAPRPSPEQEAAVARFLEGGDLKVRAVAGSGKTTTLRLIARETQSRMLYLAFNRSVKQEAEQKFPRHVEVKTLHGLAYGEVVKGNPRYESKLRSSNGQVRPHHVIEALKIRNPGLGLAIRITLERFIRSGADEPLPQHIPVEYFTQRTLHPEGWAEEEARILQGVKQLWGRMQDEADPFPLSHDGYVRIWAERGAKLNRWEGILVDEAQDLDPVFLGILEAHRGQVRRIYVGDPRQQIYGWRGAINAMEAFGGEPAHLSMSFRFGEAIAGVAREIAGVKVRGNPTLHSEVVSRSGPPEEGAAFIFRTNARLVAEAAQYASRYPVEVVGGVTETASLVEAALKLKEGKASRHPLLAYFKDYGEFARASELSPELKGLRRLVEGYRDPLGMVKALERKRGRKARYVFATVHKAKGLEWDVVVLGDDYPDPNDENGRYTPEEANIRYVAATRAKRLLDLRW